MKIWDSTSNNEIILRSVAKGLDKHCVCQDMAYLVCDIFVIFVQTAKSLGILVIVFYVQEYVKCLEKKDKYLARERTGPNVVKLENVCVAIVSCMLC